MNTFSLRMWTAGIREELFLVCSSQLYFCLAPPKIRSADWGSLRLAWRGLMQPSLPQPRSYCCAVLSLDRWIPASSWAQWVSPWRKQVQPYFKRWKDQEASCCPRCFKDENINSVSSCCFWPASYSSDLQHSSFHLNYYTVLAEKKTML